MSKVSKYRRDMSSDSKFDPNGGIMDSGNTDAAGSSCLPRRPRASRRATEHEARSMESVQSRIKPELSKRYPNIIKRIRTPQPSFRPADNPPTPPQPNSRSSTRKQLVTVLLILLLVRRAARCSCVLPSRKLFGGLLNLRSKDARESVPLFR